MVSINLLRMIPLKKYIPPLLFLIILVGCQQKASSNDIYNEANNIYLTIKDTVESNSNLTEDESDKVDEFKQKYINNYKDYPSDEELISKMESLINSYRFYKMAIEMNKTDGIKMYKENLDKALNELDKEFNR
jgi:hypothetical protein